MSVNALRLGFAAVWLVAAGVLLTGTGGRQGSVGGLLAVAFAVWNLARWWQARPQREVDRRPPRPPGGEYHPEFDFRQPPNGG